MSVAYPLWGGRLRASTPGHETESVKGGFPLQHRRIGKRRVDGRSDGAQEPAQAPTATTEVNATSLSPTKLQSNAGSLVHQLTLAS
jgi:hypothetical protein